MRDATNTWDVWDAEAVPRRLPRFADRGVAAYQPGLERTARLLEALGRPQDAFGIIHVAGTNGKGSTASFIAAIATAAGLRIGLHTSPHLFHETERMRIDGQPASRAWLADAVHRTRSLVDRVEPSYFEWMLALSLLRFAEHGVELAIIETGMGGRLDATNVLTPDVSVITDIDLDHTDFLGDTIEQIAREKAGIIKPGVPVIVGARSPAAEIVRATAEEREAPFHPIEEEVRTLQETTHLGHSTVTVETPVRTYHTLTVGLPGRHQVRNALTALRAAETGIPAIESHATGIPAVEGDATAIRKGLEEVQALSGTRGRFTVLREEPLVVADVAHNAGGLAAVLDHLRKCRQATGALTVLFGAMRDKDIEAMGRLLATTGATVRPVRMEGSDRSCPPKELAASLRFCGVRIGEPCTVGQGLHIFLAEASPADTLLITGSHTIVSRLEKRLFEERI